MRTALALILIVLSGPALAQAVVVATCGSKTFAVGTTNYVTMNPQGYLCVSSTTTAAATEVNSPVPAEPTPKEKRKK